MPTLVCVVCEDKNRAVCVRARVRWVRGLVREVVRGGLEWWVSGVACVYVAERDGDCVRVGEPLTRLRVGAFVCQKFDLIHECLREVRQDVLGELALPPEVLHNCVRSGVRRSSGGCGV